MHWISSIIILYPLSVVRSLAQTLWILDTPRVRGLCLQRRQLRQQRPQQLLLQRRQPISELMCNEICTQHSVSRTRMQPALTVTVTRAGPCQWRINRIFNIECVQYQRVFWYWRIIIDIDASQNQFIIIEVEMSISKFLWYQDASISKYKT